MNKKYSFVILRSLFNTTDNLVYPEQCKNLDGRKTEKKLSLEKERD